MKTFSAKLLLAFIFIARGTSFIFTKTLMNTMSPLSVLGIRFTLAFIILALVFNKRMRQCSKDSLIGGILLGLAYTACLLLETYGLRTIDTGTSAFIDNMAIVIVPVYVAIFTRKLPKLKTVVCAVIAVAGVGCLSLTESRGATLNIGIILTILAALTYAGCILLTDYVTKKGEPLTVGMLQLATMGVVCLVFSFITDEFTPPQAGAEWAMLLMLILVCSCFGMAFQPVAQKPLNAETAALFSVMNPLTSAVLGIIVAAENHGPLKITGCMLILVAMIMYNLRWKGEE